MKVGDDVKRFLRIVTQAQGNRLTINGRSLINFSSNNYLGLARHPQVVEAVKQVLDHWGAGATSSRLISGSSVIHQDLESALAAFVRREAALVFPSGYMANLGVLTALSGPGDAIVMDRLCHASLVDAARLSGARLFVYHHADASDARQVLARAGKYPRRLLVSESLFSMDGDFAPLEDLQAAARETGALSIVDDAHALGVWTSPTEGWDVVVGTLSKALGSQGGFVAASREVIDLLVNKARSFIFTTGLSPLCVAAAQAALSLIQQDPEPAAHVKKLSARLRGGLKQSGFNILGSQSHIVPVLLGEAPAALACAEHLYQAGFFVPAIRPPTVHAGECRIRLSVTAEHTEADIDQLLSALKEWKS
jgi:8-amino-7-oxononanoate synthase